MVTPSRPFLKTLAEGYWILPDGTVREVADHMMEVEAHPEIFGVDPGEVADWKRENRKTILRSVVERGPIRVRGHRTHVTVEAWAPAEESVDRIARFLRGAVLGPDDLLRVNFLGDRVHWDGSVAEWTLTSDFEKV